MQKRFKRSLSNVLTVKGRTHLRSEHQPLILVEGVHLDHLLSLTLAVTFEGFDGTVREAHGSTALRGLGDREHRTVLCLSKGPVHPQGTLFQVHVRPSQTKQLALPKTAV